MDFIKKFFTLLGCIVTIFLFSSCSEDYAIQECDVDAVILSRSSVHEFNDCDSIMPLVGDSITMRKVKLGVLLTNVSNETSEELQQLDQIPVYLQIKGNTSVNQFLSAEGEGKELVFKPFKDKDDSQQFFIKTYSAVMGIPYMIYSKKTNTPISLGSYSSNPSVKVVYAKRGNETSTFGASWDIRNGEYHTDAFIIENQDYPQQGSSGSLYDTFYSVISANDSKVTLEKYQRLPRQEFSIIPVEDFRVESVRFDTKVSALNNKPYVVLSDKFINDGPVEQNHTFAISETYRETSSFNKRTSYSVNVTTKVKVKVPFIANGEISTSISEGQDFTYGETEEHTTNINRTYPITVPANYIAQMTLTLSKYIMDVEYCAVCVGMISGMRINIRGTWSGVDVQESIAYLKITPINGDAADTKMIPITPEMVSSDGYIKIQ